MESEKGMSVEDYEAIQVEPPERCCRKCTTEPVKKTHELEGRI